MTHSLRCSTHDLGDLVGGLHHAVHHLNGSHVLARIAGNHLMDELACNAGVDRRARWCRAVAKYNDSIVGTDVVSGDIVTDGKDLVGCWYLNVDVRRNGVRARVWG